jgi:integrase/recombinase XerC
MQRAITDFLEYLAKERRLSPHTVTAYANDLARFRGFMEEHLEKSRPEEVDHNDVRSWVISTLEDEGLLPQTVNRRLSCLRSYFKYLRSMGIITTDPMPKVTALRSKKALPLFIDRSRMEQLLEGMAFGEGFAGMRDRIVIELLYGTGMRRAELIGLKVSDVDMYAGQLKVLGKRAKERVIPFSAHLSGLLKEYLKEREVLPPAPGTHGLIVRDDGSPINESFVYQKVNKYLRLVTTVGKRSPHVLRHTFATHMLNNGADINAVKELLGHASLAATQVYTHNTIDKLKRIHQQAHPRA